MKRRSFSLERRLKSFSLVFLPVSLHFSEKSSSRFLECPSAFPFVHCEFELVLWFMLVLSKLRVIFVCMLQQLCEMIGDSMSFCACAASVQLVSLKINCNWTPNLYITNMLSPRQRRMGLEFQK